MKTSFVHALFASVLLGLSCSSSRHLAPSTPGQSPRTFEKKIRKTLRTQYWLYLPGEYPESGREWPLILFLHGAGERGNDLEQLTIHGPPKRIAREGQHFPFVILSPQCPEGAWWTDGSQIDILDALLDEVVSRYRIDEDRIYVTGLSMGGFGTWRLATVFPERFAAIAPICGGGNPWQARRIAHLPAWVFHGARDEIVPIDRSESMVSALEAAGGDVTFTVYPDARHDSWTETYENPALYDWFLRHRRQSRD